MNAGAWVFGYGSLASPESIAATIGRPIDPQVDLVVAHLVGYGRRWNYGSLHLRGAWEHDGLAVQGGIVISLGLALGVSEEVNGVLVKVDAAELAALDWRERDYARTDVTDRITVDEAGAGALGGRVVTYVPRPSAVERYERASEDRRAAIRRSYWELVHEAFASLGGDHLERFGRTTPPPDVPVADITLDPLPTS